MADAGGPVTEKNRIAELDVLRGFALLGVLVGNLSEYLSMGMAASSAQLAALPTAGLDSIIAQSVRVLVTDKFSTLFAVLFGVGFYLQLERMAARRADYKTVYLRRLVVLLLFGVFQMLFFFPWDILSCYAVTGILLFTFREAGNRVMLIGGLVLAIAGGPAVYYLFEVSGLNAASGSDQLFTDQAVLARQAALENWSYGYFFDFYLSFNWRDWLLAGGFASYTFYAMGRFMIGVYTARKGWLMRPGDFLREFRSRAWLLLIGGLALEAMTELDVGLEMHGAIEALLGMTGTLILAAAYVCLIVTGLQSKLFKWLLSLLAPVGKMALTNYSLLGFLSTWIVYGPGGTAGQIGMTYMVGAGLVFFLTSIIFSNIWLRYFRFGPLEWGWRALTYFERPAFRR